MDGKVGDESAVYRANLRQAHEDHVTGHTGCTWYEVMLAFYPIFPGTLILNRVLAAGEWTVVSSNFSALFVLELVLCVLPLTLVLTALHNHLATVAVTLTLAAVIIAAVTHPYGKKSQLSGMATSSPTLPCVTLVRSFVGLNTAIAILAVDCHAFPRRFAKTEQSGYSVMDTGAAAFLLINALVDVLPTRRYSLRGVLKGCAVLTVLGGARLAALHLTQYPQHSTEYGTHSNFFFVLAFVKLVCQPLCRLLVCGLPLPGGVSPLLLLLLAAAALTAAQDTNVAANKAWVLGDQPRDTLINANRETLVGLPGYAALYYWGALIGLGLFELRRLSRPSLLYRAAVPCAVVAVWAAMFWLSSAAQEPSRRLINREFILWMVLLLLVLLLLSCALEDYLTHVQSAKTHVNFVPPVLQAINRHQLEFFLAANMLTGAVNLSVDTLSLQYPVDVGLICAYIVTLCAGVLVWRGLRR